MMFTLTRSWPCALLLMLCIGCGNSAQESGDALHSHSPGVFDTTEFFQTMESGNSISVAEHESGIDVVFMAKELSVQAIVEAIQPHVPKTIVLGSGVDADANIAELHVNIQSATPMEFVNEVASKLGFVATESDTEIVIEKE